MFLIIKDSADLFYLSIPLHYDIVITLHNHLGDLRIGKVLFNRSLAQTGQKNCLFDPFLLLIGEIHSAAFFLYCLCDLFPQFIQILIYKNLCKTFRNDADYLGCLLLFFRCCLDVFLLDLLINVFLFGLLPCQFFIQ